MLYSCRMDPATEVHMVVAAAVEASWDLAVVWRIETMDIAV
jgi:hypothetical protein